MTNQNGRWERTAVEDESSGRRHIAHDPVHPPEVDVERLRDRAVFERGVDEPAPKEILQPLGDVVGRKHADAALLDLALVDGRYERSVIESCLHRLLAAWEIATNGDPTALDEVAEPHAKQQLLRPARGLPSVIREPRLRGLNVIEVNAKGERPMVTVRATVGGEPNIRSLDLYWMLAPNGAGKQPWVLRDAKAWKEADLSADL